MTQVIAFEGNGQITEFGGGYDDWLRYTEQRASAINLASKTKTQASATPETKEKPNKIKLSFKEQQELKELSEQIEALEKEIELINATLARPDIYKSDLEKATKLQVELTKLDEALLHKIARWEALEIKNSG